MRKIILWVAANIALLVAVPTWAFFYLTNELQAEYQANPNMSTDGDSISIPVFGLALLILIILVVANLGIILAWRWKKSRTLSADE